MASESSILEKVYGAVLKTGTTATFAVETGGEYSPETGKVENATIASYSVKVSPPVSYRQVYPRADQSFKEGHAIIMLPAKGITFTPKPGMTLTTKDGRAWKIQAVDQYQFKDTLIAWQLEVSLG